MADKRISQLPLATGPTSPAGSDVVAIDGASTRKFPLSGLGDVLIPVASQVEAEAGVNNAKRMTPLTVSQAIIAQGAALFATSAQGALASSALQADDIGTTSGTIAAGDDQRIVGALQPVTGAYSFQLLSSAQAAGIPSQTKRVWVQARVTQAIGGGANYRRISFSDLTGYPSSAYFRSSDQFMPDGTTDATNGGYWLLDERTLYAEMFGAVGNAGTSGSGATDDTAAFQAANDYLFKRYGGGEIRYTSRHLIGSNLILSRGVGIKGTSDNADPGNSFSTVTAFYSFMRSVPALILSSSATLRLSSACSFVGNYVFRSGLSLNGTDLAANYAGTAITINTPSLTTDGTLVARNTFAGFAQWMRSQDSGRIRVENNLVDANAGIWTTNSGDFNRYIGNHLYNILQANATGYDTTSLRSGTAFLFDGSPLGGAYLVNNFDYGYNISVDIASPGQITVENHWFDGPTAQATGRPLNVSSIGIRTASLDYLETTINVIRGSCKGTAFVMGATAKGIGTISDIILYHNNVAFSVTGQNLEISNFNIRAYDSGFNFNSKVAGNTALLVNGVFYDRNAPGSGLTGIPDPIDINAGTGSPSLVNVTRIDGLLDVRNELRPDVTAAAGVITLPGVHAFVRVTGSPTVTNITPAFDGREATIEASAAGLVISGSNFLLASGTSWTSTQVGANITFAYSRWINKWVEVRRGPQ